CPMLPARYADRPYLYNADNPLHQRAAMVLKLLEKNAHMTVADALEIAVSPQVYNADLWQARLTAAWEKAGEQTKANAAAATLYELIAKWDRRADPDSTGAIAYRYWKDQLGDKIQQSDRAGLPPPRGLGNAQLLQALAAGAEQ